MQALYNPQHQQQQPQGAVYQQPQGSAYQQPQGAVYQQQQVSQPTMHFPDHTNFKTQDERFPTTPTSTNAQKTFIYGTSLLAMLSVALGTASFGLNNWLITEYDYGTI
ncbi:hypothetical protein HDU76_009257, partial [Blyttiomyces sp. JEL0837]